MSLVLRFFKSSLSIVSNDGSTQTKGTSASTRGAERFESRNEWVDVYGHKSTRSQKSLLSVRVQPQHLGCRYQLWSLRAITADGPQADLKEGDEMLMGSVRGSTGENWEEVE